MAAKVISLVNQKGGVGKTTTAVNIARYLADAGKRVLIVDLDPQGNATSGLGYEHPEEKVAVYQALGDPMLARELPAPTKFPGLHIAASTPDLAGANVDLVAVSDREFRLQRVIDFLRDKYDFIIIDNSPSLGLLTVNGLVASDDVLIPVQAEYYALEGLRDLLHTISLVQDNLRPGLGILGAVVTMYDARNSLSGAVLKELKQYFPNRVFETVIPRTVRLAEAPSFGLTIKEYDASSKGAQAYQSLVKEIINQYGL